MKKVFLLAFATVVTIGSSFAQDIKNPTKKDMMPPAKNQPSKPMPQNNPAGAQQTTTKNTHPQKPMPEVGPKGGAESKRHHVNPKPIERPTQKHHVVAPSVPASTVPKSVK